MEERSAYIKLIEDLADYTTDVQVSETDRLVVLSTCAYEYQDARYMVVGKMVPWDGQSIDMSYDEDEGAAGETTEETTEEKAEETTEEKTEEAE